MLDALPDAMLDAGPDAAVDAMPGPCIPVVEACNGVDDDCNGTIDDVADGCPEIRCAAETTGPPCNGCPAGTVVPGSGTPGDWVCVPAGEFEFGCDPAEEWCVPDEGPPVPVTLTRPLLVGAHPVTEADWSAVFRIPLREPGCPSCVADDVTWYDAARYANYLSDGDPEDQEDDLSRCYVMRGCVVQEQPEPAGSQVCNLVVEHDPACAGYRLPTEAEHEYFTRAGTTTRFWSGDDVEVAGRVSWHAGRPDAADPRLRTVCSPLLEPPTHPWGLCDVQGNVWEWSDGWYADFPQAPADGGRLFDPVERLAAPDAQSRRALRGASYNTPLVWPGEPNTAGQHAASRSASQPHVSTRGIGFRIVRPVPAPAE